MRQIICNLCAVILLFACSKKTDSGPLKAVAEARYNGSLEVNFISIYSTGPIAKWQWIIDANSPTKDSLFNLPVNNVSRLYPFVASVHKTGTYIFGLSVYDKNNNISYDTVSLEIK